MSDSLILLISDGVFFWACIAFLVAITLAGLGSIRLALKGEAITSLMGVSSFTTVAGVGLYLISLPELFNVGFARDTAIALLVLGAIGTIVFARIFRTEE
jgi:multisubunit Na+/H+ antiporter MnhF subunit